MVCGINENEVHLDILSLPLFGESSYVTLKTNESQFSTQSQSHTDNAVFMGSQPDNCYVESNSESDNDNENDNDTDYNIGSLTNIPDFEHDTNKFHFMKTPERDDYTIVSERPKRNKPSKKFLEGFQGSQHQKNQEDF